MGGDAIFDDTGGPPGHRARRDHRRTARSPSSTIECNAACDYAPVVMVNWEFFDNQTPSTARDLVDGLRAGERRRRPPAARRGVLVQAGLPRAGRLPRRASADEGVGAGGPSLRRGTRLARTEAAGRAARACRRLATTAPRPRRPRRAEPWRPPLTPVLSRILGRPPSPGRWPPTGATTATRRCARRWAWRPTTSSPLVKDSGLRGRGGAGFPTGHEVVVHPASRTAASRTTWWSTPTSPNRAPARTSR